jgi:hypothetical protein
MSYHVTAPLVVAKQPNGSDLYLYQGAPVPDGLADGEIKRLEEGDFIEKDAAEAKSASKK